MTSDLITPQPKLPRWGFCLIRCHNPAPRSSILRFPTYFNIFIIDLAAPGLSCGIRDLPSSLRYVGSLVAACKLLVAACGILFPIWGWNLGPLHQGCGVLGTGPPGKSPSPKFSCSNYTCSLSLPQLYGTPYHRAFAQHFLQHDTLVPASTHLIPISSIITLGPLLQEASLISLSLKPLFLQLCYFYTCEHPVCHYCCWVRLYPVLAELTLLSTHPPGTSLERLSVASST